MVDIDNWISCYQYKYYPNNCSVKFIANLVARSTHGNGRVSTETWQSRVTGEVTTTISYVAKGLQHLTASLERMNSQFIDKLRANIVRVEEGLEHSKEQANV